MSISNLNTPKYHAYMLVHQNMLDSVLCIKLCECNRPIAGKCCIVESGFALGVCQFRKGSRHGKFLYDLYFGIEFS